MMSVMTVDLQVNAAQLQGGIKMQVEAAERDPGEARKLFGIDQMSIEERKVELRKATLVCFPMFFVKRNLIIVIQDLAALKKGKTTLVWFPCAIQNPHISFIRTSALLRKATNSSSSTSKFVRLKRHWPRTLLR